MEIVPICLGRSRAGAVTGMLATPGVILLAMTVAVACSEKTSNPLPSTTATTPPGASDTQQPSALQAGAPQPAAPAAAPAGCPVPPTGVPSVLVADDTQDTTRALIDALLELAPPGRTGGAAEAILRRSRPGKGHEQLEAIVGYWDAPSKFWIAPGVEPVVSPGYSVRKMIMGGRFVYEDYEGYFFGKPFRGLGLTAYDNVNDNFPATWIDTFGTTIMVSTGVADETGKVFTFRGQYFDTLAGRWRKTHSEIRVFNKDSYQLWLNFVEDDGSEYRVFQVDYTRRK